MPDFGLPGWGLVCVLRPNVESRPAKIETVKYRLSDSMLLNEFTRSGELLAGFGVRSGQPRFISRRVSHAESFVAKSSRRRRCGVDGLGVRGRRHARRGDHQNRAP